DLAASKELNWATAVNVERSKSDGNVDGDLSVAASVGGNISASANAVGDAGAPILRSGPADATSAKPATFRVDLHIAGARHGHVAVGNVAAQAGAGELDV